MTTPLSRNLDRITFRLLLLEAFFSYRHWCEKVLAQTRKGIVDHLLHPNQYQVSLFRDDSDPSIFYGEQSSQVIPSRIWKKYRATPHGWLCAGEPAFAADRPANATHGYYWIPDACGRYPGEEGLPRKRNSLNGIGYYVNNTSAAKAMLGIEMMNILIEACDKFDSKYEGNGEEIVRFFEDPSNSHEPLYRLVKHYFGTTDILEGLPDTGRLSAQLYVLCDRLHNREVRMVSY